MTVMMGDEEEEDPLALIVETLRAATEAVRVANAAAEAARAEAKEFHGKLAGRVLALEKKVDAFTKRLNGMMASHLARYGWGLAGAFIGLSLGTFLLLMLAAFAQRTHG